MTVITKQNEAVALAEIREWCRTGRARVIREAARVARSEACSVAGVSQATLWRWEAAQRMPRGAAAVRYHRLLCALRDSMDAREAAS